MYKREFDGLLASGELPKALLLYGEAFFVDRYVKKVLSLWGGGEDNILSFYFDEYHYESAKNYLSQPSLFGDLNILYLRVDKKLPKKELDSLVALSQKVPSSFLLLHFCGSDAVGKELAKSFGKKKGGEHVRFFQPSLQEAVGLLHERAKELGVEIENFALQHLLLLQNEDLSLAANELEKLALLPQPVDITTIDRHTYGMGTLSLDDFVEKLLQKEDIKEPLERILESGVDGVRILNAVENYLTQLLLFHIYIKVHGRFDVVEILGYPLPPQLAKTKAAFSIKIKLSTYEILLKHLLESEHMLKTGQNIDKTAYLLSALIKLQTLL